ncbi:MAG: TrmH family RNA methyltransferase [Polyangiaceae bacterium]|nr:TrmH family RNA methyltransferase [Polyangiaceae bacterium]
MPLDTPIDDDPAAVREALAPLRNDFSVALVAPGNPFAIGGVIRVAHNFLARDVMLVAAEDGYPKASMGMHRYEQIVRLPDVETFLRTVKGRPVWAVEKDHARRSIHAVERFPRDVVLTFGSERFGLPPEILDAADDVVGIAIYGVNHSLPLVVAAGIAMHEWARRRYAPGSIA